MVSYNKSKKELTIKDSNDIKDLVKSLPKEVLNIDITGSIKLQVPNIILDKDSSLTLDNGRYLIVADKITCKENSSLVLGSDEKDSIYTKVMFNIKNISTVDSTNITFKNVVSAETNHFTTVLDVINAISSASSGSTAALSTKLDTIETKVDEVKAIVKKTASAKIV